MAQGERTDLVRKKHGGQRDYEGEDLIFTDEVDAGRGIQLLGEAITAKTIGLIEVVKSDQHGALAAANDLSEWLGMLQVADVSGRELLEFIQREYGRRR